MFEIFLVQSNKDNRDWEEQIWGEDQRPGWLSCQGNPGSVHGDLMSPPCAPGHFQHDGDGAGAEPLPVPGGAAAHHQVCASVCGNGASCHHGGLHASHGVPPVPRPLAHQGAARRILLHLCLCLHMPFTCPKSPSFLLYHILIGAIVFLKFQLKNRGIHAFLKSQLKCLLFSGIFPDIRTYQDCLSPPSWSHLCVICKTV